MSTDLTVWNKIVLLVYGACITFWFSFVYQLLTDGYVLTAGLLAYVLIIVGITVTIEQVNDIQVEDIPYTDQSA